MIALSISAIVVLCVRVIVIVSFTVLLLVDVLITGFWRTILECCFWTCSLKEPLFSSKEQTNHGCYHDGYCAYDYQDYQHTKPCRTSKSRSAVFPRNPAASFSFLGSCGRAQ